MNKSNPLIEEPNPYEGYKKSAEDLAKEHPEVLEMAKLCYEVFECHPDGKKLLKILEDRFLLSSLVNPIAQNASECCLYWTGFADCIRGFKNHIHEHQQRINAWQKE